MPESQFPASSPESLAVIGICGILNQVHLFLRIPRQVEQPVVLVLEVSLLDHQVPSPELRHRFPTPTRRVPLAERSQTAAVQTVRGRDTGEVAERGKQVAQVDVLRHRAALGPEPRRPADEQRHPDAGLEELLLLPDAVLAQHLAVVRRVDDDPLVEVLAGRLQASSTIP